MVRKIMIAIGVTALGIGATACNTVKGAGEDIQSVGEAGSDAIGNR
jgi:predicted small secreted protein